MLIPCSRHSSETGTPPSAGFNTAMIRASLNRPFFIVNPLRYLPEKILLLNTTSFRGDDLMTAPDYVVITVAGEFKGETTAIKEMW